MTMRMMATVLSVAGVLACFGGVAMAEPAATTRPAGAAAAADEAPNQVFPRIMAAVVAGDEAGVSARIHADGDDARKVETAMNETAIAASRLRAAAGEKFGADKADAAWATPMFPIPPMNQTIDGDTAKVAMPGGNETMLLLRKDGRWKLSLDDVVRLTLARGQNLDDLLKQTRMPIARFDALTDRVKKGEFASADEVANAMRNTIFRSEVEIGEH